MAEIDVQENMEKLANIMAFRKYKEERQQVYIERHNKFLTIYPIGHTEDNIGIIKFRHYLDGCNEESRRLIGIAVNKEREFWDSYFVKTRCPSDEYKHILNVIAAMEKSLQNIGAKSVCSIDTNDSSDVTNWGRRGEQEVEYVLKWLPKEYAVIEKDCVGKYGDNCILLKNDMFMDEKQEYDHIVVGPQGVFLIETKNYSGKVNIDASGNWTRMKKGSCEWEAETNPSQQVLRHHLLMDSILNKQVPIYDIVCLAHPDVMVSGIKNSTIPVIKCDQLGDYILRNGRQVLSSTAILAVLERIQKYKVSDK